MRGPGLAAADWSVGPSMDRVLCQGREGQRLTCPELDCVQGPALHAPVKWINAIFRILTAAGCIIALNSWNNSIQSLYCHLQLADEETGREKLSNLSKDSQLYMGKWKVAQSCLTLCNPMGCSLPGSSVHGTLQARILQWVAIAFSRGSSQPRDRAQVLHITGRFFTIWPTRETPKVEKPGWKLSGLIPEFIA